VQLPLDLFLCLEININSVAVAVAEFAPLWKSEQQQRIQHTYKHTHSYTQIVIIFN